MRTFPPDFDNGCTKLHPQQHCFMVPVPPHPEEHLLFFLVAILQWMGWNLVFHFVLSFIFPVAKDTEHFYVFIDQYISSLRNVCSFHLTILY
jgi:hypothetical protein